MRHKLPPDREGKTHKIVMGAVEIYLTVNLDDTGRVRELFSKCTEGHQGQVDALCETASLYLQCEDGNLAVLVAHWLYRKYLPDGAIGQGSSLPDAMARVLKKEYLT